MHYSFADQVDSIRIDFPSSGTFQDTFYAPKIEIFMLVSNPPQDVYLVCGEDANEIVTDFYEAGKIRKTGHFKDGFLVDTLKEFYFSGNLRMLTIVGKHKKWMTYYENGNVKVDYNVSKRYENQYYPSGKLKYRRTWDKKFNSKVTEYHENGEKIIRRLIPLDG